MQGLSVGSYYYFQRFLVQEHDTRGGVEAVLIGIGAYRALMLMGPGSVRSESTLPLPVCSVGRFRDFEQLNDGTRVARFEGVYLGFR